MDTDRKWLAIGQIARRSGVNASALRFYEQKGLLRSVRSEGGQRLYPQDALRRIAFIG
jgi:MerR family redox-sensitive transcriptional activator SoxR